jgi:ketosteroid isomerase-like protein
MSLHASPSIRPTPVDCAATQAIRGAAVVVALICMGLPPAAATPPSSDELQSLAKEVTAREQAFAQTLTDRRFDRFADFVATDAVFHGSAQLLVGREAVMDKWKPLYDGPNAPFSWEPDLVTVSADGRSALSTGPVRDASGHVVSRFMTIWQLEADGRWRVHVDQGVEVACPGGAGAH